MRLERVADSHAIAAPAVLQVLRQQQGTVLKLSGGDDHRIPPAQAMTVLDVVRPQQQVAIVGLRVPRKQCAHIGPGILGGHAGIELASDRDVVLVQNLDSGAAALLDPCVLRSEGKGGDRGAKRRMSQDTDKPKANA
jgi:hypothetical protein